MLPAKEVTDVEQLNKILKSKLEELKPVYLLYGAETYLIDEFIKKFIKRFVNPEIKEFMLSYIREENEANFDSKLSEICHTITMVSPFRIVIAICQDRLSKKQNDQFLTELFANFPDNTILLMISKSKPDLRLNYLKQIKKIGEWIEFNLLKDYNLSKWIESEFSRANKQVAKDGIKFLEEHFHNNLQQLKSEITKIITFIDKSENITLDDIKAVISRDVILKDTIIFDLVDAVGNRQIKKALKVLDDMERHGEPIMRILKMFIRQLRLIMYSKEMFERGFPPEDTAKRLQQHPFPIKKCYQQAKNFTMKELELALERMLLANYDIVTGRYPDKIALQLALIDLKENNINL